MKIFSQLLLVLILIGSMGQAEVWAADPALEERVRALEQEVAILKRQLEIGKEESAKKTEETPIVSASAKDGFTIKSPDESFKLKIRGLLQTDGRIFFDHSTDTFTVRRARPIFEGTVGTNFDFYLVPDFGGGQAQLQDAYGEFKFAPEFKLRGGKYKAPLGLERLQSDAVANFVESGMPSNLVPNRDVGFQLSGDVLNNSLNYAVGIFNGGPDGANVSDVDVNSDKDFIGRVFAQPFKDWGPDLLQGFGVGVGGSYGERRGSTLPTYRSSGQATVFTYAANTSADGEHFRISPQVSYYNGSFGIFGEYVVSEQEILQQVGAVRTRDTFTNDAWQVSANYVLTGELASYKGITPRNNFDIEKGTWGAFEVVGRYGELDIDNDIFSGGFASLNTNVSEVYDWGLGVNWYPHKLVRLSLDFEQNNFDGGATGGWDRQTENVALSRFQVSY